MVQWWEGRDGVVVGGKGWCSGGREGMVQVVGGKGWCSGGREGMV